MEQTRILSTQQGKKKPWWCFGTVQEKPIIKKILLWMCTMIVRLIVTYESIAWSKRTNSAIARNNLSKEQRLISVCLTMKTCRTAFIEVVFDLVLLHIAVEGAAKRTMLIKIKERTIRHRFQSSKVDQTWYMPWDDVSKKFSVVKEFITNISNKSKWDQDIVLKMNKNVIK